MNTHGNLSNLLYSIVMGANLKMTSLSIVYGLNSSELRVEVE